MENVAVDLFAVGPCNRKRFVVVGLAGVGRPDTMTGDIDPHAQAKNGKPKRKADQICDALCLVVAAAKFRARSDAMPSAWS